MRLNVLGFAIGVWLLQMQAVLPSPGWWWWTPALALAGLSACDARRATIRALRRSAMFTCCLACGFLWAAWLAGQRLADALPVQWEGADIQVVGVVATMPQPYERSLRFEFDVERVLTPDAVVPTHIAVSWWGSPERDGKPATFPELHAGERWQLTVRLRRPHGTLNPHGFDYEAWLLDRNIRATGTIRPGGGNRRVTGLVVRPQYLVERVREAARSRIQTALADAPYAGVLAALAIGDQRAIAPSQWQIFTRTGVNHLMSISCGIACNRFYGAA